MSDPISPAGSQGQVSQVATPVLTVTGSNLPSGSTGVTKTEPAVANAALKTVGTPATPASELELSPSVSASTRAPETPKAPKVMNVAEAAQAFQDYLKGLPSDLQFEADSASGIVVFKVIHPITQKVIRQYPPEEMLAVARNIRNSLKTDASGIILDRKL